VARLAVTSREGGVQCPVGVLIKVFFVLIVVAPIETQFNLSLLSYSHEKIHSMYKFHFTKY
jgi:hypothetical protein